MDATCYLAPEEHVGRVVAELEGVTAVHGRLVVARGPAQRSLWAHNVWLEPAEMRVGSISDAARKLRAIQRSWWPYAFHLHRRTELLKEKLPHVSAKPLRFPEPAPASPLGSFVLVEKDLVLASARCTSPFPNGEPRFVEHAEPPSRAYLKLFEALTLLGSRPKPGETCLDLGASPGGWTWVLARLGARVVAYDRAPLDPAVAGMDGVSMVRGNAFAATPERAGAVDWIFSDVVCAPEKILAHVRRWLDSGLCRRFVCTLKFQSGSGYGVAGELARIEGSRVVHLSHNRHELTWMLDAT